MPPKKKKNPGTSVKRSYSQTAASQATGSLTSNIKASKGDLSEWGCDRESLESALLTRINQALTKTGCGNVANAADSGSDNNPSDDRAVFIKQVLPAMVTAAAATLGEVVEKMLQNHAAAMTRQQSRSQSAEVNKVKSALLLRYQNDRLEQYTRKESVRIVGLKEDKDEDVEKKVLDVFQAAGADIKADDITAVHRTGRGGMGQNRHVLVRFLSRKKKHDVMSKRKNLRDNSTYKQIFINDDLTILRAKLMKYVKSSGRFGRVWAQEGKIFVGKKTIPGTQNTDRPAVIETADDLFRLGFDTVDPHALGLAEWWVDAEIEQEEDEEEGEEV